MLRSTTTSMSGDLQKARGWHEGGALLRITKQKHQDSTIEIHMKMYQLKLHVHWVEAESVIDSHARECKPTLNHAADESPHLSRWDNSLSLLTAILSHQKPLLSHT